MVISCPNEILSPMPIGRGLELLIIGVSHLASTTCMCSTNTSGLKTNLWDIVLTPLVMHQRRFLDPISGILPSLGWFMVGLRYSIPTIHTVGRFDGPGAHGRLTKCHCGI